MREGPHLTRVGVILNPRSAGGRTAQVWPRILSHLEPACESIDVFETQSQGHATELAGNALKSGCRTLIAVGGDGTLNEVVNGVLGSDAAGQDVLLGLIPRGTGSDFRRTVRLPLVESDAVDVIRRGKTASIDAMRVIYHTPGESTATRYAINLSSFGMGGRVAARVNRSRKPIGAKLAFLTATAITAVQFSGDPVSLSLDAPDGGERFDLVVTNVAAGNGQYHGSGMHVCPLAVLDDGLLDVTIVEHLSLWEIARNNRLLFNGRIYDHPRIHHRRAHRLRAEARSVSAIEIDGEPLGRLPIEIEVVPGAVRFIVP